jgi:hypothetical protein
MTKKENVCLRYIAGIFIALILSPILFPIVLVSMAMDKIRRYYDMAR